MTALVRSSKFWGLLLILGGVLFLLENLGIIAIADIFWVFVFGLVAVFFFSVFASNREFWWALIPGFIFAALAAVVAINTLAPDAAGDWVGSLFLAGIGLPFLVIYLVDRKHWWAIIPGGVLLTLAAVAMLSAYNFSSLGTGGIFFVGLGLTFALVALAPTPAGRMTWAWIPSAALVVMGILVFAAAEELIGILWPAAVIAAGLYLLLVAFRRK
jgi:hypothetical protein